jgi:hypothetical protein
MVSIDWHCQSSRIGEFLAEQLQMRGDRLGGNASVSAMSQLNFSGRVPLACVFAGQCSFRI